MAEAKRRGFGEDAIYFDHRADCQDSAQHRTCIGRWRGVVSRPGPRSWTRSSDRGRGWAQPPQMRPDDEPPRLGRLRSSALLRLTARSFTSSQRRVLIMRQT
jgi:hypothetical protein